MNWSARDIENLILNPFYCITVDPRWCVEHPPLIDVETWIVANARLINKLGAEAYLGRLLAILAGDSADIART